MKKVLVVEDNKTIADLVTERLKADGFRARSVSENSAIWKNIDDWNPDIILLDIMMPGEDGISILLRLKSNEDYKHIRVHMLTALTLMEDVEKALEIGADGYFTKPFKFKDISRVLWK